MARSHLPVDRQNSAQRQLDATTVAPGSNRVREPVRVCAAHHASAREGVGHETDAQPRVYRPQHEVGVCRPDEVGGTLKAAALRADRGDTERPAAPYANEG